MANDEIKPLKEWRLERYQTQDELSREIGVTQAAYARWETGVSEPSLKNKRRIAIVLGVKPWQVTYPATGKGDAAAA